MTTKELTKLIKEGRECMTLYKETYDHARLEKAKQTMDGLLLLAC